MHGLFQRLNTAIIEKISPRQLFIKYSLVVILPLLLVVLFVQSSYITRIEQSYHGTLNQYAFELCTELDTVFLRLQSVAEEIMLDNEIGPSYTPQHYTESIKLMDKLKEHCKRVNTGINSNLLNEIILYCEGDSYFFSSNSSYTISYFSQIKKLDDESLGGGMVPYLSTCEKWSALTDGYEDLLIFYPIGLLGHQRKVVIFSISEKTLTSQLSASLHDNKGVVLLENDRGDVLLQTGDVKKTVLESFASLQRTPFVVHIVAESGDIVDGLTAVRGIWRLILVIAALIALVEALILALITIQPFRSLNKKLAVQTHDDSDEYHTLSMAIDRMRYEMLTLQEHSRAMQSQLVEKMLFNGEDASSALKLLAINYDLPTRIVGWRVVVIPAVTELDQTLNERLHDMLPAAPRILIRNAAETEPEALLLAYAPDTQSDPASFETILTMCLHTNRLGMSDRCDQPGILPIAYTDAVIRLNKEKRSETLPDEARLLLDAIGQSNASAIDSALAQYLQKLDEGAISEGDHRMAAVQVLIACQTQAHTRGKGAPGVDLAPLMKEIHLAANEWTEPWRRSILDFADSLAGNAQRQDRPLFDQMCDYVKSQCCYADFSVQDMATFFKTTPSAINSSFKKEKGLTVIQYLTEQKMVIAKELLRATDLPVYEIGLKLGYYGPNSFIRRFKQEFNVTPGEYRSEQEQ